MPINPISIIAGTLSFSAAIAWNRAVNDSLQTLVNRPSIPPVIVATVITIIIIMVVYSINTSLKWYERFSNDNIKSCTKISGGNKNSKVSIWKDK